MQQTLQRNPGSAVHCPPLPKSYHPRRSTKSPMTPQPQQQQQLCPNSSVSRCKHDSPLFSNRDFLVTLSPLHPADAWRALLREMLLTHAFSKINNSLLLPGWLLTCNKTILDAPISERLAAEATFLPFFSTNRKKTKIYSTVPNVVNSPSSSLCTISSRIHYYGFVCFSLSLLAMMMLSFESESVMACFAN
ncbi:hypothetical protein CBL_14457 [Carabus blaptoides fortunei]